MDTLHQSDSIGNPPEKKCSGPCGRTLPAITEFFSPHKNCKYGVNSRCKACRRLSHANSPVYPTPPSDVCKQCTGPCGRTLPATIEFFQRNKRNKQYGLRAQCRECEKQYRIDHKDEKAVYDEQYRLDHKEERSESGKIYYKANRKGIRVRQNASRRERRKDPAYREKEALKKSGYRAASYPRHREEILQSVKRYAQTPRGRMVRRAAHQRRYALKKSYGGSYTADQLQDQMKRQKNKCYWCGCKLGKGKRAWHADHVLPLSRGGSNTIDNIVISCPACNMHKHNKMPHEWAAGGRLI